MLTAWLLLFCGCILIEDDHSDDDVADPSGGIVLTSDDIEVESHLSEWSSHIKIFENVDGGYRYEVQGSATDTDNIEKAGFFLYGDVGEKLALDDTYSLPPLETRGERNQVGYSNETVSFTSTSGTIKIGLEAGTISGTWDVALIHPLGDPATQIGMTATFMGATQVTCYLMDYEADGLPTASWTSSSVDNEECGALID